MATYARVPTIEQFGALLLTTQDLDPLYVALAGANLERDQLRRWLIAYWCCYNAGAASWLSELAGEHTAGIGWATPNRSTFWTGMEGMAANRDDQDRCPIGGRWPRGHERRHFRGQKAIDAVLAMERRFPRPESLLAWLEDETLRGRSFYSLRRRVIELPQFGPWIAFKVADMLERVVGLPIDFQDADVMMFEQPYQSALEVWRTSRGSDLAKATISEKEAVRKTTQRLLATFNHRLAPPKLDRAVNIQEVETILCKWKSHNSGSYPVGLDSRELRHGLEAWGPVSETARKLLHAAPKAHAA